MHLDSEVTVVQRSDQVSISTVRHDQGHVIPNERGAADGPFRSSFVYGEKSFPRCYITPVAHESNPPDKACITSIIEFGCTASLRLSRSRTSSPSINTTMCWRTRPCSSRT